MFARFPHHISSCAARFAHCAQPTVQEEDMVDDREGTPNVHATPRGR